VVEAKKKLNYQVDSFGLIDDVRDSLETGNPIEHYYDLDAEAEPESEDQWVCTRDLPPIDRRDCILEYLEKVGKPQTRSQIESGAGYRKDGVLLDPEDYKALKRMIQRDLQDLVEQGLLTKATKPNPKHVRGRNDDVVLYWFASDQESDSTPPPPTVVGDIVAHQLYDNEYVVPDEVKGLLTQSLTAKSRDDLMKYLTDALSYLCRTINV
jgi:hypothetical protein